MLLIAGMALIFIGPKQLPHIARVIARTLNEFKRATADITKPLADIKNEITQEAQTLREATQKSTEWISEEANKVTGEVSSSIQNVEQKLSEAPKKLLTDVEKADS